MRPPKDQQPDGSDEENALAASNRIVEATEFYDYADHLRATVVRVQSYGDEEERATQNQNEIENDPPNRRPKAPFSSGGIAQRTRAPITQAVQRAFAASDMPERANNMLRYMRSTRGLMRGSFFFRHSTNDPWLRAAGYITPHVGGLVYRTALDAPYRVLIPDLHACKVTSCPGEVAKEPFIRIRMGDHHNVQFRPHNPDLLNEWFAAFLCWRPVQAKDRMHVASDRRNPKPLPPLSAGQVKSSGRKSPGTKNWRDTQVLRREDVLLLDSTSTYVPQPASPSQSGFLSLDSGLIGRDTPLRINATCSLSGSGQLTFSTGSETSILASISITSLSRSAIQRVDYSVFNMASVLAIRPRYGVPDPSSQLSPVFFCPASHESFETWFVLLQTLTWPDLYGPSDGPEDGQAVDADLPESEGGISPVIRIRRSLSVQINKVKISPRHMKRPSRPSTSASSGSALRYDENPRPATYHAEVLFDDQVVARTARKAIVSDSVPFNETFSLPDAPSQLSTVGIRLVYHQFLEATDPIEDDSRSRKSGKSSGSRRAASQGNLQSRESSEKIEFERAQTENVTLGEAIIELVEISKDSTMVENLLFIDSKGEAVGDVGVRIGYEEEVIMADTEYERAVEIFEKGAIPLSLAMASRVTPAELPFAAGHLLNLCQTLGIVHEWLVGLAEEEINAGIDHVKRDSISSVLIHQRAGFSTSQSIPASVGILFRANTLLTKALDLYMKRVGKAYLEETLREKLRDISLYGVDCEVDPSRLKPDADLERNWHRLLDITTDVWLLIAGSVRGCPMELRAIFRHISRCANRAHGRVAPNVRYTSVSGFLFLRFFCAAILNPHLFGLLDDESSVTAAPEVARTFMLIAKSLQGLANMTHFGNKEPWMARMNEFCSVHREGFKKFIDDLCAIDENYIPPNGLQTHLIAHSSTRSQYMRLSPTARMGISSLPYLIDRSRDVAAIVRMWLEHTGDEALDVDEEEGGGRGSEDVENAGDENGDGDEDEGEDTETEESSSSAAASRPSTSNQSTSSRSLRRADVPGTGKAKAKAKGNGRPNPYPELQPLPQPPPQQSSHHHRPTSSVSLSSINSIDSKLSITSTTPTSTTLAIFRSECVSISRKTSLYYAHLASELQPDIPPSIWNKWASLAEEMEQRPIDFWPDLVRGGGEAAGSNIAEGSNADAGSNGHASPIVIIPTNANEIGIAISEDPIPVAGPSPGPSEPGRSTNDPMRPSPSTSSMNKKLERDRPFSASLFKKGKSQLQDQDPDMIIPTNTKPFTAPKPFSATGTMQAQAKAKGKNLSSGPGHSPGSGSRMNEAEGSSTNTGTGTGANTSSGRGRANSSKKEKKERKKSPERTPQELALRKLGWI